MISAYSHMTKVKSLFIFFFQAEDGIRDSSVTGVQTCALPIYRGDEFAGRADLVHAPFTHHRDPIAERKGFFLIVRDVNSGQVQTLDERAQLSASLFPQCAVQIRKWLTKNTQRWPHPNSPADATPLSF